MTLYYAGHLTLNKASRVRSGRRCTRQARKRSPCPPVRSLRWRLRLCPPFGIKFLQERDRSDHAESWETRLKFSRVRSSDIHQVQQMIVAADDELGVGGQGEIYIVRILRVNRVTKKFRNIGQFRAACQYVCQKSFDNLRIEAKSLRDRGARCEVANFTENEVAYKEIHPTSFGKFRATTGRP